MVARWQIPLRVSRFFWLFPLVAASAWFITLFALLLVWLVHGRPVYPGQSNPHVAFVSDIGSTDLRPVFLTGCAFTAFGYAASVICVHWARYSPSFYAQTDDKLWRKIMSAFAMVLGLWASLSLILLARFDTVRYPKRHLVFLLMCFTGLSSSAFLTTVVWWREGTGFCMERRIAKEWVGLRRWVLASNSIVLADICAFAVFVVLVYGDVWYIAGLLEWTLTFIGCGYLFCFAGYLWVPQAVLDRLDEDAADGETQPLLRGLGESISSEA